MSLANFDVAAWQERIHRNAVDKGWWTTERPWAEVRILVVSEVAEALEEFRAGRMDVWHGPATTNVSDYPLKPEGFPVELADAAIRLLDYAGFRGWTLDIPEPCPTWPDVPSQLDTVVYDLYIGDDPRDDTEEALATLESIAAAHGIDLAAVIKLKHDYNCTRPYRHGGKAA